MKRVTELNSQKPWLGVVISSKMNSAIRGQIDQQLLLFNSLELRPLNQPTNQIMMEAPSLMTHTRNLCIIESNMVHLLWVLEYTCIFIQENTHTNFLLRKSIHYKSKFRSLMLIDAMLLLINSEMLTHWMATHKFSLLSKIWAQRNSLVDFSLLYQLVCSATGNSRQKYNFQHVYSWKGL